jgi:alkanesulfonate monooxygenase SsuD/methylene tetrahydromethanopterin reductase-like flavin-dependent oxidoreductase (luciferase family)
MVTADHVGRGRFGLNVVCGWYQKEFDMLGVDLGSHDRRYDLGQEWVDILTRAWSSDRPFDYAGEFYKVKGTLLEPKPYRRERPILVSAGMSGTGRNFALRNADMLFTVMHSFERLPAEVESLKRDAAALGRRDIGVFTNVAVVCRPTEKEAKDYHHFYAVEHADHGAVETMVVERGMDKLDVPEAVKSNFRLRAASGNGAYPIVGDPDQVADVMRRMSEAGVGALAIGLPNYLKELPYLQSELLPRLERLGLRIPSLKFRH